MQTYLKILLVLGAVLMLLVSGVVSAQEETPVVTDGNAPIIIQRGQSEQLDAAVEAEPQVEPAVVVDSEGLPEEGVIDVAATVENEPETGAVLGIGTLVLLIGLAAIVMVGGAMLMRERLQNGAA